MFHIHRNGVSYSQKARFETPKEGYIIRKRWKNCIIREEYRIFAI